MDFLLGGKKKNKVPKTGQVSSTMSNGNNMGYASPQMPNGTMQQPTQNNMGAGNANVQQQDNSSLQFEDNNNNVNNNTYDQNQQNQPMQQDMNMSQPSPTQNSNSFGNRRSVSDVINKIHTELKSSNERLTGLV